MVALRALGYSINAHDEGEIKAAYNWSDSAERYDGSGLCTGDDVIDNMISGNKALAIVSILAMPPIL